MSEAVIYLSTGISIAFAIYFIVTINRISNDVSEISSTNLDLLKTQKAILKQQKLQTDLLAKIAGVELDKKAE